MEEDWDNLIILDACRFDVFKELNNISGKLEYRISRGSHTHEFLMENFHNKIFNDTIYITATPQVNYHVSNSFYKIIPVWENDWNEKFETVLPENIVQHSIKTEKKYPNKRLIIHFIQPHYPFIGKIGRKKIGRHTGIAGGKNALQITKKRWKNGAPKQHIWRLAYEGKVDIGTIWEAYKENLEIVLDHVKKLIPHLKGKTIITADHGNLFGERVPPLFIKKYGHPEGFYFEALVKVPWLIIENKNRKKIIEGVEDNKLIPEQKRIQIIAKGLKGI